MIGGFIPSWLPPTVAPYPIVNIYIQFLFIKCTYIMGGGEGRGQMMMLLSWMDVWMYGCMDIVGQNQVERQ